MVWVQDTTIAFETETKEKVISPLIPILAVGGLLLLYFSSKKCKTCGG